MVDPITLEVLRCKLEAIAGDGSRAIIRTAISPLVAEAGDCSCTIFSADGELVVGGGLVQIHFHVGCNGIRAIRELHGDTLASGDIFLVNDPYNGGGLHAQDVFIHMPVFHGDRLVAWVGSSAHMMDVGGMVPGSFASQATEAYQEALRLPPVRLAKAGVEQQDVWNILRNNIRMAHMIEMDMRSLISGANLVRKELEAAIATYGPDVFCEAIGELSNLTEEEVRRRIAELEPGTYTATSWAEWSDEMYRIPCEIVVEANRLIFDFHGASAQSSHFFNSKPYVIKSLLGVQLAPYIAKGLPFNEGLFRTFEVRCEPGSILDAQLPAPIGGPHLAVGQTALEVALRALNLAAAASPEARARENMAGPSSASSLAVLTLAGRGLDGQPTGWLMTEGSLTAASAGHDRDGLPTTYMLVGSGVLEIVDVEVLESWYPIRFDRRALRTGPIGAGTYSAGRPMSADFTVDGTSGLSMNIMSNREAVPIAGAAGGLPGGVSSLRLKRAGQDEAELLAFNQDGIPLWEGDKVAIDVGNGGGWGDPFCRDWQIVTDEVRRNLLSEDEARSIFGVVPGSADATVDLRDELRRDRLARAEPPPKPLRWDDRLCSLSEGSISPLTTTIDQKGGVAVARASGAPLAVSPDHWTMGCPRIRKFIEASGKVDVIAYLDPENGNVLATDVVPAGESCSFSTAPRRWTDVGETVSIGG